MDEQQYQIDLLKALNKKLSSNDRILRMICESPDCAYIYYHYRENKMEIIGNIQKFSGIAIWDIQQIVEIVERAGLRHADALSKLLYLESSGKEAGALEYYDQFSNTWVECSVGVHYQDDGIPVEKIISFRDVTKFNAQKDELLYMAYYDCLTGLYNRNYFVSQLNGWIQKASETNAVISVLFINMDDFRKVNYSHGIVVGDELVQVFGQFLKEFQSENVMISHFTADIFSMAIYNPCGTRSVEHIYNTLQRRIQKPFQMTGNNEIHITVSVGVAEYPEAALTALELLNCAEIVMRRSKEGGKNTIHYYNAPIIAEYMQAVSIEEKLKFAIANHSLMLYFQPQYDAKKNGLRGVEALLRWRDVDGSLISPSIFIPIAEQSGIILAIGDWVLNEAFRIYMQWKEKYHTSMVLSVNISTIQYKRPDFVSKLVETLKKHRMDPKDLELEVTESVLIEDLQDVIQKMNILRDYGIRISLDDFGTGFSSMSYLKGLPIDTLKIDKTFIDTLATDEPSQIITQSIISMVKKLGFETVAEGVETMEQYDYLKDIDCDNIQGFLLGRPMPEARIDEILLGQMQ